MACARSCLGSPTSLRCSELLAPMPGLGRYSSTAGREGRLLPTAPASHRGMGRAAHAESGPVRGCLCPRGRGQARCARWAARRGERLRSVALVRVRSRPPGDRPGSSIRRVRMDTQPTFRLSGRNIALRRHQARPSKPAGLRYSQGVSPRCGASLPLAQVRGKLGLVWISTVGSQRHGPRRICRKADGRTGSCARVRPSGSP
jgi:hypothetical protein